MRCPECAAEVNPLREFCGNCGTPTDPRLRAARRSGGRGGGPVGRSPEELKRNRKTVLAIGGGVLILAAISRVGFLAVPHGIHINRHHQVTGPVVIGAPELFEAYHRDTDAARQRFGNRQMVVTGEFVRTVPDGYGSIDMRLKTNHPDLPLGIDLDNHSVDAATKLQPGQVVTVSCRRVAGSGDDPWLEDCVLQPPPEAAPGATATPPSIPPPPSPPPPPSSRT